MGFFSFGSKKKSKSEPKEQEPTAPPTKPPPRKDQVTAWFFHQKMGKIENARTLCEEKVEDINSRRLVENKKLELAFAAFKECEKRGDKYNSKLRLMDCALCKKNIKSYDTYIIKLKHEIAGFNQAQNLIDQIALLKVLSTVKDEYSKELDVDAVAKYEDQSAELQDRMTEIQQYMDQGNTNLARDMLMTTLEDQTSGMSVEFSDADNALIRQLEQEFGSSQDMDISIDLPPVDVPVSTTTNPKSNADLDDLDAQLLA